MSIHQPDHVTPDGQRIAAPPAVHEGPFDPRPPGAMSPEQAPYRYLVSYIALKLGHEVRGTVEVFMPGPIRSSIGARRVRELIAEGINSRAGAHFGPEDLSIFMLHLLAKEA